MNRYDVTVIGSGPGGYVAAIRCAQLGLKTAIIEKYSVLGGTCTNVGCIPSKALLDSSEHFYNAKTHFKSHGIETDNIRLNFGNMMIRKNSVVKANTDGLRFLMKKNKIDVYEGTASFLSKNKIEIVKDNSSEEIESHKFIIATGSKPSTLPNVIINKDRIISSTEALSLSSLPESLIVIGGGVIGCELASVYARLGTKVKIIEYMPGIIAAMDGELGKELLRILKNIGIEVFLSHKVDAVVASKNNVIVTATNNDGKISEFTAQYCLIAVGRKAYTDNLGLEKVGIGTDKGQITVNRELETTVKGIYAIGDVIKGPMLAHKAEDEGVFVAELIAGQKPHINYNLIPNVVYTWPEVASVGLTEDQLKQQNISYKKGSFPFKASGRARAAMETDGFIKVLADASTDEMLGVHMIGARAADLIAEAVLAMEYRASAEDIARISHAHPTYTEAFKEACLAATDNRAIHI